VRDFFLLEGFLEVETPYLQETPNLDPHVEPFRVEGGFFLHTSPEYQMKKLLGAGSGDIFQICRVFRKDPVTPCHRREFTMVEWYRVGEDYRVLMDDVRELTLFLAQRLGVGPFLKVGDREVNLSGEWYAMSVSQAFQEFTGVDPLDMDEGGFRRSLEEKGLQVSRKDSWETCFHYLFVAEVEPALALLDRPVFLYHYPASLSVMARLSPEDPRVCERVELFVGGVELMNGYSELTDPEEQRRRLEEELLRRGVSWSVDEELLEAVGCMPTAAGAALGFDRLLTVLVGEDDIGTFVLEV